MQAPLHPFKRRARLLGYSLLGAGLYPVLAARVFARQRRRVSIPPAPASVFPRTDPLGTGAFSTLRAFMPDLAVYLSELEPEGSRLAYRYSSAFTREVVPVAHGISLACRVAAHADAGEHETLLFIPGMFATATQNVVVELAERAFRSWGYNVVVADMRAFGDTARLSNAPSGMGSHESEDVVALARWAKAYFKGRSVNVMGFSFGGAIALSAALSGSDVIDRCVAFCPPLDTRELIAHFSQPVRGFSSFSLFQVFYQWLLLRSADVRGQDDVEHFADYVANVVGPHYGLEADALYTASDVRPRIGTLAVDTLIIHADDDPVVPHAHTLELAREATRLGNTRLSVAISKGGGHYGHWAVMPEWTERTVLAFLKP